MHSIYFNVKCCSAHEIINPLSFPHIGSVAGLCASDHYLNECTCQGHMALHIHWSRESLGHSLPVPKSAGSHVQSEVQSKTLSHTHTQTHRIILTLITSVILTSYCCEHNVLYIHPIRIQSDLTAQRWPPINPRGMCLYRLLFGSNVLPQKSKEIRYFLSTWAQFAIW